MTDEQRRAAVRKMIRDYTAEHGKTPESARKALISEGIYTKAGNLRAEFGGKQRTKKVA